MRFVYDRKNETGHKKKEKGKKYKEIGLLQVEVRKDGTDKRSFISTHIKIKPEQFTDKNGFTCKNHENAKILTTKAHDIFRRIEAFVCSDKCTNIDQVKYWDKNDHDVNSVIDFIESEMRNKNITMATLKSHNSFLKRLKEYDKIKTFNDINYTNIVGFDRQMRKTIESDPVLYKRHSLLKGYIQEAINRGIFKGVNPYNTFKIKKGKSKDPIYLIESEIELLKKYSPNFGYLERARDLYLFQCYTGLAFADLMQFNANSVQVLDGYKTIQSNRQKTDENFILLFLPDAEKIADKYKYELPKLTNQKYNEYLKEVAKGAGINKPLISHSARHTFATYLLNKDVPIETVARALGHTNIKQTQHYARLLGKKVIDDMKKLL